MTVHELVNAVTSGNIDHLLKSVHDSDDLAFLNRRAMILNSAEKFSRLYPLRDDIRLFFATVRPDFSLKFGEFSVSAVSSSAVVIAAFHGESVINISAGNFTAVLDTETGTSTGDTGNILRNIAEKYDSISGFDLMIETAEQVNDVSLIASVIESVLDCFYKKTRELPTADPELFFAGYSLCVTEIPGTGQSNVKNICEPPAGMSEDDFYSRLPELKKEMDGSHLVGIANYFKEIRRSELISETVISGDIDGFFRLIDTSSDTLAPETGLAIALSSRLLQGDGASFAAENAVFAFVPTYTADSYADEMRRVFGNCSVLKIGSSSAVEITI